MSEPRTFDDLRADWWRLVFRVLPSERVRRRYLHAVRHANARYWGEPLPESCRYCRTASRQPDPQEDRM